MNCSRATVKTVVPFLTRHTSDKLLDPHLHPRFQRLKELQKFYQSNDSVPVYLKRGLSDKILFYTSVLSVTGGTLFSIKFLIDMAYPKK